MDKIGFYLFSKKHGKKNIGSSRIRGHWLIDKWEGAEELQYATKYDVIIYQKVYETQLARTVKEDSDTIQILDLCDPDWLTNQPIVEMIEEVDAVTCSSKGLYDFLKGVTDKPVKLIEDRVNIDEIPPPKEHKGKAKMAVWFGYSHNDSVIHPVLHHLHKAGLRLRIVSNSAYMPQNDKFIDTVDWVMWENSKQADKAIQEADFAVLPASNDPKFRYKSPNKTYHCWALGLPVAHNLPQLQKYILGEEREKESKKRLKQVKEELTTETSVTEYKELIDEVKSRVR